MLFQGTDIYGHCEDRVYRPCLFRHLFIVLGTQMSLDYMKWLFILCASVLSAQTMVRPEQVRDWNQFSYADSFTQQIATVSNGIYNPVLTTPTTTTRVVMNQVVVFGLTFNANFAPITAPITTPCTPTPGYLSCVTLNTVEIDIYSFFRFQQAPPPTGTSYSQDVITMLNFPPCVTPASTNCTQCAQCGTPGATTTTKVK
jgi:hypothetical protein